MTAHCMFALQGRHLQQQQQQQQFKCHTGANSPKHVLSPARTSRGFMHLTATSLSCQRPRHVSPAFIAIGGRGTGDIHTWTTIFLKTWHTLQQRAPARRTACAAAAPGTHNKARRRNWASAHAPPTKGAGAQVRHALHIAAGDHLDLGAPAALI